MSAPLPNPDFAPGSVLAGKYRIERQLGAGGMGMVFEATHLVLAERVAIKVLLPQEGEGQGSRTRFIREAQAAARISSIHVSKVRDVGELDSGEPFIVMDYLEGFNLDSRLKEQGALPVERAVKWMLEACQGLAAAHAVGVIHRDIKAANLFVASTADGGSVLKILDFGISKLTEAQGLAGATLTGTNASMGSPLTMSPEQMLSPRDVDARTDIWSMGTVLYRCLSGAQPFEAESLPQLCVQVMDAQFVPLQSRRPDLPAGLFDIVGRCLRKTPAERYPDVAELAQALAPFAGESGAAAAEQCRRILRLPAGHPPSAASGGQTASRDGKPLASAGSASRRILWAALAVAIVVPGVLLALRGGRESKPVPSTQGQQLEARGTTILPPQGTKAPSPVISPGVPSPDAGVPAQAAADTNPSGAPAVRASARRPARQPGRIAAPPAIDPFGQRK